MYYVMWLKEEDIDDNTIGGAVAYECESKKDAIAVAKHYTQMGHPCSVEHYDIIWEPE